MIPTPVREAFSNCSTGTGNAGCYNTKAGALRVFNAVLAAHGYHLDCGGIAGCLGDTGRCEINVYADGGDCVGKATLYYYRRLSGRYEFVGFLT